MQAREHYLMVWPDGDAKRYDTLADMAEDYSAGFPSEPTWFFHLLEDGKTYHDAENNLREAVQELKSEAAPYPRMEQREFV